MGRLNLERDGKLIQKAYARLAPEYRLTTNVVKHEGHYIGIVCAGESIYNRGSRFLAISRPVKREHTAECHAFEIAMHYYRMELRMPGYIKREVERARESLYARYPFGKEAA